MSDQTGGLTALNTTSYKGDKFTSNLGGSLSVNHGIFDVGVSYDARLSKKFRSSEGSIRVKVSL